MTVYTVSEFNVSDRENNFNSENIFNPFCVVKSKEHDLSDKFLKKPPMFENDCNIKEENV